MARECKNRFPSRFTYHKVGLEDFETENVFVHFTNLIEFLVQAETSNKRVFVHCQGEKVTQYSPHIKLL
jgi:hypothetical protein